MQNELKNFLDAHKFPGRILFAKVWGSRSHHCEKETSDWDFSGVYAATPREILGMSPPKETCDGKDPDYSFHEVGKFCKLLLVGNPAILEMLWTDRMFVETPEWEQLRKHRREFLSKEAVKNYLGYTQGQLDRLMKEQSLHTSGGKYSEKWAYHITRLVADALRIVRGEEPRVWKEGHEQEFLMRVRRNEFEWTFISDYVSEQIAIIDGMKPWNLPDLGNKEILEDWLMHTRLKDIQNII